MRKFVFSVSILHIGNYAYLRSLLYSSSRKVDVVSICVSGRICTHTRAPSLKYEGSTKRTRRKTKKEREKNKLGYETSARIIIDRGKEKKCIQERQTSTLRLLSTMESSAEYFSSRNATAELIHWSRRPRSCPTQCFSLHSTRKHEGTSVFSYQAAVLCPKVLFIRSTNQKIVRHFARTLKKKKKKKCRRLFG